MKMRETHPAISHINTFSRVLFKLSSQRINFKEEVKALALLSSWEVFCTTSTNSWTRSWIWTKRSANSSRRIFGENQWDSPSMSQQKPTIRSSRSIGSTVRESRSRESAETRVDRDIGKIDNGPNRGIVDQVSFALTAERPITRFLTAGRSRGRRTINYLSGTQDDPT